MLITTSSFTFADFLKEIYFWELQTFEKNRYLYIVDIQLFMYYKDTKKI